MDSHFHGNDREERGNDREENWDCRVAMLLAMTKKEAPRNDRKIDSRLRGNDIKGCENNK